MPFAKTGPVYTTPNVRLVLADAPWLADAAVSSWSVDRRLVASVIPGTLRQANGLSVGAASVKVINTESRVTPWSTDPDRLVTTDTSAGRLEVVDGDETLPLGAWVLNPVSGALSSREVDVDLLEAQYAGKQVPALVEPYGAHGTFDVFDEFAPVDPAWTLGRLMELAGFPSVPPAVPSALLVLPLHGSLSAVATERYPASPFRPGGSVPDGWAVLPGDVAVGTSGEAYASVVGNGNEVALLPGDVWARGDSLFFTLNVDREVWLYDNAQLWAIQIVNDFDAGTHTVAASNDFDAMTSPTSFAAGESSDWPTRVQIEAQRDWDEDAGEWTEIRVRARSGPSGAWSSWVMHSVAVPPVAARFEILSVLAGANLGLGPIVSPGPGAFAALQVTTEADPALWAPSRAYLQPLGGDEGISRTPAETDTWAAIQGICSAWLAAAIVGNDGILRVLTKDDLAAVASDDPIVVDVDLADLPWDVDPNDRHDRLEVTYAPPLVREQNFTSGGWDPIAWEAEEVIHLPPNATVEIRADFENAASLRIDDTFRYWHTAAGGSPSSYYNTIWTTLNADGTGVTDGSELGANAWSLSSSSAMIRLRNFTGSSLYIADPEGNPSLQLRSGTVATYETPVLITRGKTADDATNPLAVDLTPWVQREQDATAIANYLWGRLSGAVWKVSGVKCRLDWTLDIGQIRTLTHAESGLESKVLITAVKYDGKPGQIEQTLDLVLIPWTYADFAAAWDDVDPASTYADFATAQGPTPTYADMAADHNWTGDA